MISSIRDHHVEGITTSESKSVFDQRFVDTLAAADNGPRFQDFECFCGTCMGTGLDKPNKEECSCKGFTNPSIYTATRVLQSEESKKKGERQRQRVEAFLDEGKSSTKSRSIFDSRD